MVGAATVEVPALDSGLRWVLAIGKDAALRHELDGYAEFAGHSLKFDWLGDSVMFGIADRAELTSVAHPFVADRLEPPNEDRKRPSELDALAGLPLYASVELKNRLGAVVALGVLRKLAEEVARDVIQWRDGGKHREVAITDVAISQSVMLRGGHVYYALCPKALIFALNRSVLERLIDDELDGKSPRGAAEARRSDGGQFVIELGAKKDGALLRVIGWLAAAELVQRTASRLSAEAVLRGAPESRASADAFETFARATLGHVPLTPDGNLYQYSPEGIRDPVRGTPYAPVFPPTPVAGSPLATVLARFARIRTSIAFDTEPGTRTNEREMQSFSAKVSLELR